MEGEKQAQRGAGGAAKRCERGADGVASEGWVGGGRRESRGMARLPGAGGGMGQAWRHGAGDGEAKK